jgi:hypothetical protein
MTTFVNPGPTAEKHLKELASVACSTGVVDQGVWLRISRHCLNRPLDWGHRVVVRHY